MSDTSNQSNAATAQPPPAISTTELPVATHSRNTTDVETSTASTTESAAATLARRTGESNAAVERACLLILTFIATGFALAVLKPVLVPFVLAVILTLCLVPLIDLFERKLKLPHLVAVVASAAVGLGVLVLLGLYVATSITKLSQNLSQYQGQLHSFVANLPKWAPLEKLGLNADPEAEKVFTLPEGTINTFVGRVLSEATGLISNGAIVLIFMIFLLMGRRPTRALRRADREAKLRGESPGLLPEIESRLKKFALQTIAFSIVNGLLVGFILMALGVQFAGMFGFMAFLLNFIPNIGSAIATFLPLPIVMLDPQMGLTVKVLAILLPAAQQFILGNIIQPRVMGDALQVHPVAVLMALIFFGMIWGLPGAFLATPIVAAIRIILDRIPSTRPIAQLIAGDLSGLSGK